MHPNNSGSKSRRRYSHPEGVKLRKISLMARNRLGQAGSPLVKVSSTSFSPCLRSNLSQWIREQWLENLKCPKSQCTTSSPGKAQQNSLSHTYRLKLRPKVCSLWSFKAPMSARTIGRPRMALKLTVSMRQISLRISHQKLSSSQCKTSRRGSI